MRALRRAPALVGFLCFAVLQASVPLRVLADEVARAFAVSPAGRADAGQGGPSASPQTQESTQAAEPGRDSTQAVPDSVASLDRARALIKDGEYDGAIEVLKASIQRARSAPATLRDAYLLLIKTYVFIGNDLRFRPQGREASNLNYQEARKLIAECLGIEALRHTYPEPASEYPPEMIGFFSEVRSRIFGSFRVVELEPPGAVVLLDGDTLGSLPGDSLLGDVDLGVGPHRVVVMARGFRDATEEVLISPNSMLERSYRLTRRRGPGWYAAASSVALAAVIGIFAVGRGSAGTPPGLEPLPPAPPPPAR